MPYNMFLDFSVFFGRLLFKMLFIGLITYTKIAKLAHIRMDFKGIMQSAWTRKG